MLPGMAGWPPRFGDLGAPGPRIIANRLSKSVGNHKSAYGYQRARLSRSALVGTFSLARHSMAKQAWTYVCLAR